MATKRCQNILLFFKLFFYSQLVYTRILLLLLQHSRHQNSGCWHSARQCYGWKVKWPFLLPPKHDSQHNGNGNENDSQHGQPNNHTCTILCNNHQAPCSQSLNQSVMHKCHNMTQCNSIKCHSSTACTTLCNTMPSLACTSDINPFTAMLAALSLEK